MARSNDVPVLRRSAGSEVDDEPMLGHQDAELPEGGVDPDPALAHRAVGEPHHLEPTGAAFARDLDAHGASLEPDECRRMGGGEHAPDRASAVPKLTSNDLRTLAAHERWRPPPSPGASLASPPPRPLPRPPPADENLGDPRYKLSAWSHPRRTLLSQVPFTPTIRLFIERLTIDGGDSFDPSYGERELPVIQLTFDYQGTVLGRPTSAGNSSSLTAKDYDPSSVIRGRERGATNARGFRRGAAAAPRPLCRARGLRGRLRAAGRRQRAHLVFVHGVRPPAAALTGLHARRRPRCTRTKSSRARWRGTRVSNLPSRPTGSDSSWGSTSRGPRSTCSRRSSRCSKIGGALDPRRAHAHPGPVSRGAGGEPSTTLMLPPERLRSLLEVLIELYRGEPTPQGRLRFPGLASASLAKLEDVIPGAGGPLLREAIPGRTSAGRVARTAPLGATGAARRGAPRRSAASYQQEGLTWLQHLRAPRTPAAFFADDMGLGKTLQTIAHLAAEKEAGRARCPGLIVAPTSLVGNWQRELARFAPALTRGGRSRSRQRSRAQPRARRRRRAHHLPAAAARRTSCRHASSLPAHPRRGAGDQEPAQPGPPSGRELAAAEHRLCLTGTPIENHLGELWSLLRLP